MEFLSKTGRRRPRAGGHCFATKGRSHCAEQEGNGWGEELRRRPWVPVNCEMLPLRDASSLCVSVDSSCKQRACEFGLTPDVGFRRATSRGCYLSGMLPLGDATCLEPWTKHMEPHQLSDNNEPYERSYTSCPALQTSDMFEQLCP